MVVSNHGRYSVLTVAPARGGTGGHGGGQPPPLPMISRIDFYIRRNSAMRKRRARGRGLKFSNSYLHACFGWSSLKTLVQIVYINPVMIRCHRTGRF